MNDHKGVQGRRLTRSELPPCRADLGWVKPSTDLASVCKFAGGPETSKSVEVTAQWGLGWVGAL